jgi:hypothetical protein
LVLGRRGGRRRFVVVWEMPLSVVEEWMMKGREIWGSMGYAV